MYHKILATLVVTSGTLLFASCGGSQSNTPATAAAAQSAEEAARKSIEADAASAAAAHEAELALQTSELKAKEADLAAREAEMARAAARKSAPPKTVYKPAPVKPVAVTPVPKVVTVPAGTELRFALASDISTKSARVGDTFRARLISDVVADGQVAMPAGTVAVGSVTRVVSGSDKIGTTPTLALRLDHLEYSGGKTLPISGEFSITGKSEKGQDTAKIAGGAAAGAVIGHQVNDKSSGTIVGGLIGAAAGTLAAKKTGSEVKLTAGSEISVVLAAPLRVQLN